MANHVHLDAPNGISVTPEQQAEDVTSTLDLFVRELQALMTDDKIRSLQEVSSHCCSLQKDLEQKNETIGDLKVQLDTIRGEAEQKLEIARKQYQSQIGDVLNEHHVRLNGLEKDKKSVEEEKVQLQQDLEKSKDCLDDMTRQNVELKVSNDDHVRSHESHTQEIDTLRQTIKELQEKLQSHKQSMDRLDADLNKQKQKVAEKNKALKVSADETEAARKRSQKLQDQIHELESFCYRLEPKDNPVEIAKQLQSLWDLCRSCIKATLGSDFSDSVLKNAEAWSELSEQSHRYGTSILIIQSNEEPAKYMRTMLSLALLADLINGHLFTTTYLFPDDAAFRSATRQMAEESPERERFCRATLLPIDPESQAKIAKRRMHMVVEQMAGYVQNLLTATELVKLRAALQEIVERAIDIWAPLQQKRKRFEASTRGFESWNWNSNMSPTSTAGSPVDAAAQNGQAIDDGNRPALCVFPRVFIVKENEDELVFPGVIVMSSQIEATRRQLQQNGDMSPDLSRALTARGGRRQSFPPQNAIDLTASRDLNFLGGPPSSGN